MVAMILVLSVSFLFATTAFAAPSEVQLTPSEDSGFLFNEFKVYISEDKETVEYIFDLRGHADDAPLAVEFEVDLDTMTYTATLLGFAELDVAQLDFGQGELPDWDASPESSLVWYQRTVQVETVCPLGAVCGATGLTMRWQVDVNTSKIVDYQRSGRAYAYAPNSQGYNWYRYWQGYGSCGYISAYAWANWRAKYYNLDFWDPQKATYADHFTSMTGYPDGGYHIHGTKAEHSGELGWLLRGRILSW
jgi:hypothetical protein